MNNFKSLLSYAEEKKHYMVLSLIFSAIATIISFVPYYYFWQILKSITTDSDLKTVQGISYLIFAYTVLYAFTYLASLVCSHLFAFRLETNMKKAGLYHLLNASFSFFDINPSGRTRKIIDDNSGDTHTVIAHMLPDFVNAILFPTGLIVMSFMADFKIGLLILGAIVFAILCFRAMYQGQDMMKEYMGALEDINSETVEYVRGIQVIKVFGLKLESFKKLHKSIINYSVVVNRQSQACKMPYVMYQCCMMSFGALIIAIAYPMIKFNAHMSEVVSLVVFFMTFVGLLNNAVMKIMFFSKNYEMAKDAVNKLENVFRDMNKNKLVDGNISTMKNYDIEFQNVSFEYEEGATVLENFNLKLKEKKMYALVGSSGGGKSTIAKLISGFYPVKSGHIKIGGVNIKDYKNEVLEKNISFVFQNARLFNKSIYENVLIGNPDASRKEVMKALELAMCNSIIDKFKDRENTVIGAEGVHLSGGETQRIAIARAILKNAPIVILDEASAASDPENEYEMQQAFSKLMENKTVIMIAHRLSSIRNVAEILVIEDGKVVERGSHTDLMDKNSRYKKSLELFKKANEWRVVNEN